MAWDTEIVTMIRYMINDYATPQTYSDDTLITTILIASQWVQQENSFNIDYVSNIDNQTLVPDPTSSSANTRDEAFLWLVSLKTVCLIAQGELKTIGGQAIAISDEGSSIDLRGTLAGKTTVAKNACDSYEAARWKYNLGNRPSGQGIFGPFSIITPGLYAGGNMGWASYTNRDRANFF
jgi:hypothetical protein